MARPWKTIVLFSILIYGCSNPAPTPTSSPGTPLMTEVVHDEDLLKFWTKERMENAQPDEYKPAYLPPVSSPDKELVPRPDRVDTNVSPYAKVGKLFYKKGGIEKHCSAAFVGSTNRILTAAHCIRSIEPKTEWARSVIFARAYNDNSAQMVKIVNMVHPYGWKGPKNERDKWDYAVLVPQNASNAGFLELGLNLPRESWISVGYPSNYDKGLHMFSVAGTKVGVNAGVVQMSSNPFWHGASGGPWIANLDTVIGLNSNSIDGFMYGPLLDSQVMVLYNCLQNNTCNPDPDPK